jgi:hypothetical protein
VKNWWASIVGGRLTRPGGSSDDTAEIAALEARIREIDIRRKTGRHCTSSHDGLNGYFGR